MVDRFVVADAELRTVDDLLSASAGYAVTVLGVTSADTCKEVVDGLVQRTVPRETVVDLRGPWVFTRAAIAGALARIRGREGEIHDLLALCKAAGLRVHVRVD
jgi:2-C-methyl-D-erythritol 4-phosphate cytidylyltransferase